MIEKVGLWFGLWVLLAVTGYSQEKINVAVAANLLMPVQEIEELYEKSGYKIELISGASGALTTQILNGAPYHLFISANLDYPQRLHEEHLTTSSPRIFCKGTLIFWSKTQEQDIIRALQNGNFDPIAIAQPRLAPYGESAQKWLMNQGLWSTVERDLIYGNNIGQVNHYISTGTIDGAFTANSAQHAPQLKVKGFWESTFLGEQEGIPHALVVLKTDRIEAAERFATFMFSQEAQAVFKKYGYLEGLSDQ